VNVIRTKTPFGLDERPVSLMKQPEHNIGKGEVDSSILFGSTIFPSVSDNQGTCSFGHLYRGGMGATNTPSGTRWTIFLPCRAASSRISGPTTALVSPLVNNEGAGR
jgi:hypothetical protein